MNSFSFKLFNFQGIPVHFRLWFLLLFAFLPPIVVLVIFIAVLVHELSHAYVANKLGYRVYNVYIDILGGGAEMDSSMPERDSIKVVSAGPLSNLVLSILSSTLFITTELDFFNIMMVINFLLFVFNILPIKPMDGGLILRDILLRKMKRNRRLANNISDYISLVFSLALVVFSISTSNLIMGLFSLIFVFYSVKELGWIDKIKSKLS